MGEDGLVLSCGTEEREEQPEQAEGAALVLGLFNRQDRTFAFRV